MIVLEEFTAWAGALALAISLGTTIWTLMTSGSKKNGRKIDTLGNTLKAKLDESATEAKKRLDDLDRVASAQDKRIGIVENEMKYMPTKDQVAELKLSIAQLEGSMKEMGAALKATASTVANIDTYLRKDDK